MKTLSRFGRPAAGVVLALVATLPALSGCAPVGSFMEGVVGADPLQTADLAAYAIGHNVIPFVATLVKGAMAVYGMF